MVLSLPPTGKPGGIRNRARDLSSLVGRFKVREIEAPEPNDKALLPPPEEDEA